MKVLKATLAAILVLLVMFMGIAFYLSLPVVTFSYSTGYCVSVESENMNFTCNKLPKYYITNYVK